ncbi:hypothetical protein GJR96_06130 [Haloferax sp. MBLA0076]|uniref:Uncharacterized protein n=1 Tax=Haloferax litoreum TaxID=2666140 RepID=A0A6A8GEH8_9EURY|nr:MULTISPECIES: hypothetical protein [Haloferax]KAB1193042.1 hypothetical protein Hfx1148_06125 [Haloferax sp. CBA1148]MRX21533.1 hypothetical protein [Haloferax litoreum]
MIDVWTGVLVVARLVLLVVGIATTGVAYRAYRTTGAAHLRAATAGFGLITVGVFVEGVLFQVASLTLTQVHTVESLAIAAGFIVLLRSLVE